MKEAKKKVQITEQICRQAQLMRKGGASQTQIAELLGVNASTISRIETAGFDFQKYLENRSERKAREKEGSRPAEEQVEGQLTMDLTPEKPEMSDQTKMMRFQAAQIDKLYMKLETINDTLHMILRAVRKE